MKKLYKSATVEKEIWLDSNFGVETCDVALCCE